MGEKRRDGGGRGGGGRGEGRAGMRDDAENKRNKVR